MTMAGLVHDVTTAGATQSPESLMSEEEEIEADTQTNTAKYESARAKTRREKNRVAAKKCRAKKNAAVAQVQSMHDRLHIQNQVMSREQTNLACLFSQQVQVRNALEVLAAALTPRAM